MKVVIVPIEPIETRYTGEWYEMLPKQLRDYDPEVEVIQIEVDAKACAVPSKGAFLDFTSTNAYKSSQFLEVCKLFSSLGKGDKILFTDAWNPTVIQLRYMKDLLKSEVEIHGMWHAGSYDNHDFLGKAFDTDWSYNFERALYHAFDVNYFATEFHKGLFTLILAPELGCRDQRCLAGKSKIVGWPMEYLQDRMYEGKKKDSIVFPHRISSEKQPEVFRELARRLPQYEFIMCQEQHLTKAEYHTVLAEAKLVVSFSLQETLGIGIYEGLLSGASVMVPDRLSYSEMFDSSECVVVYPSELTDAEAEPDWNTLTSAIVQAMEQYRPHTGEAHASVDKFFNGKALYESLTS